MLTGQDARAARDASGLIDFHSYVTVFLISDVGAFNGANPYAPVAAYTS